MTIQKGLTVIRRNVLYHKSKSIKTMILIGIAIMGFLFTNHILGDRLEIQKYLLIQEYGGYDFSMINPTQESMSVLNKQKDIQTLGYQYDLGVGLVNQSAIQFVYEDMEYQKTKGVALLESQTLDENEIILSKEASERCKINVGAYIQVELVRVRNVLNEDATFPTYEFKVKSISNQLGGITAYVSKKFCDEQIGTIKESRIVLSKNVDAADYIDTLIDENEFTERVIKNESWIQYKMQTANMMKEANVFSFAIFLVSIFMIYYIVWSLLNGKRKEIYIMKSIGIDSSWVIGIHVIETLLYIIIGYIIDICLTIIGLQIEYVIIINFITKNPLNLSYHFTKNEVSMIMISLGITVIYTILRSMQIACRKIPGDFKERQNWKIHSRRSALSKKDQGIKGKMIICASRNVRRSKKRSMYIILVVLIPALICGIIMASLGIEKNDYDWTQDISEEIS